MKKKFQHQKDLYGCGIACFANLLNEDYGKIKKDFEKKFYTIERGIRTADILKYLKDHGLNYKSKFFSQNKKNKQSKEEAKKFSKIVNSITLIAKSKRHPVGHYLLRVKNGWIDPWYDYPSIDNVKAGIRKKLPSDPWYVLYPVSKN